MNPPESPVLKLGKWSGGRLVLIGFLRHAQPDGPVLFNLDIVQFRFRPGYLQLSALVLEEIQEFKGDQGQG